MSSDNKVFQETRIYHPRDLVIPVSEPDETIHATIMTCDPYLLQAETVVDILLFAKEDFISIKPNLAPTVFQVTSVVITHFERVGEMIYCHFLDRFMEEARQKALNYISALTVRRQIDLISRFDQCPGDEMIAAITAR